MGNLVQPIAEDCGELLVLLSLVGVGDRESIEVEEGSEKPAGLRSCLQGGGARKAEKNGSNNSLRGKEVDWNHMRVRAAYEVKK